MDVNREIENLRELIGGSGIDDDHVFAEAWQARAFALALALSERGLFSLRDFQAALIGRIISFEKSQCIAGTADYYTRWIEALEDLLQQKGMLSGDRLSLLERDVVEDAASRKVHQRMTSRDENGQLRIGPLLVDPGRI
jgi:nitrile hydratase accessory protein